MRSQNSITQNHLADISRAYYLALEGRAEEAKILLKNGYEEIRKMNRGDFYTRFWYFYDMFIYGKTNELLGNMDEALNGYHECIRSGPHSNLAAFATKIIENLKLKQ